MLVTGGSGFIGTNVVHHFIERRIPVVSLDIAAPRNKRQSDVWTEGDVRRTADVETIFDRFEPTHVVHLAARTDLRGTQMSAYDANTTGVEVMLHCVASRPIERVIFASTRMVCAIGTAPVSDFDYFPPNLYGRSKVIGEQLVRNANLEATWVIVRPTSIWGEWFDVPYREFFDAVRRRRYVHPGHDRVRKSFGYVGNVVYEIDALLGATPEAAHGRTFYLADYEPLEVRPFAQLIAQASGVGPPKTVSTTALKLLARGGDLLQRRGLMEDPPLTSFRLTNLRTEMVFELDPLRQIVGDLPFTLEEGVARTVAWMNEHARMDHPEGAENLAGDPPT